MVSLSELSSKLKSENTLALFCHIRPDGDSIGSALALSLALKNLGKKVDVICDDAVPSRFFFLNSVNKVKNKIDKEYSALVAIERASAEPKVSPSGLIWQISATLFSFLSFDDKSLKLITFFSFVYLFE